jgi:DNA-binding response OmpR family regulator
MTQERILVVDDEPVMQAFVCRVLRQHGYGVESALDGEQALSMISAEQPDLVLLDLAMPGLDGWGVLERLRALAGAPRVVVLSAAMIDAETHRRGLDAGAWACLTKPVRIADLVSTCRQALVRS